MFDARVMLVAWLTGSFIQGAETVICPTGTVAIDIETLADVHDLTDIINCTGPGVFDIKWSTSLQIEERIGVSNMKNVTITGSGLPTIGSALKYDDIAGNDNDTGSVTGLFSVSDGSTLSLNYMAFEGFNSTDGGVIDVRSSSSLSLRGCNFSSNIASNGGETRAIRNHQMSLAIQDVFTCCFVITRVFSWD